MPVCHPLPPRHIIKPAPLRAERVKLWITLPGMQSRARRAILAKLTTPRKSVFASEIMP